MRRKTDEIRDEIWGKDEGGSVRQPRQPGTQSERHVWCPQGGNSDNLSWMIFNPEKFTKIALMQVNPSDVI
jgi:hypothetical protein